MMMALTIPPALEALVAKNFDQAGTPIVREFGKETKGTISTVEQLVVGKIKGFEPLKRDILSLSPLPAGADTTVVPTAEKVADRLSVDLDLQNGGVNLRYSEGEQSHFYGNDRDTHQQTYHHGKHRHKKEHRPTIQQWVCDLFKFPVYNEHGRHIGSEFRKICGWKRFSL